MGNLEEDKEITSSKGYNKAYKQLVKKKVSSFNKDGSGYNLSNHYNFKQVRMLSLLTTSETPLFGEMLIMMRNEVNS